MYIEKQHNTNPTGGYLSYRTVYDCFKRVMVKLGLPDTRFHDVRHTYAMAVIKSGMTSLEKIILL